MSQQQKPPAEKTRQGYIYLIKCGIYKKQLAAQSDKKAQ